MNSTHPEYNESQYFNFYDAENDIGALMRVGNKPNKNEKSMFFFLFEKDSVIGMKAAVPCDADKLSCAGLSFAKDGEGWILKYNGPAADFKDQSKISMVSMDVRWNPAGVLMNYRDCVDAEGEALSANVASEHFEEFGKAEGTVTVNGRTVEVKATGERDLSEGVRDWGSPKMWYWLCSVYDGEYGYNVTKLCTQAADVDAGFFGSTKCNDPIVKSEIDTQYAGGIPSGYTITATGKSGRTYDIKATVIKKAMMPIAPGMALVETISKTEWKGRTGYGVGEFLVRMG